MDDERKLTCCLCDKELVTANVGFSYLGHTFRADLPRCPECGQVFISEALTKGRISKVETELEDK